MTSPSVAVALKTIISVVSSIGGRQLLSGSLSRGCIVPPEAQPNRVGMCDLGGVKATSKHLRKSNRVRHPAK